MDLITGRVLVQPLDRGKGVAVTMPTWSPNGRYVAFDYAIASKLTTNGISYGSSRVGRLDTRTDTYATVPGKQLGSTSSAVGVASDGTVAALHFSSLVLWRSGATRSIPVPDAVDGQFARAASGIAPSPGHDTWAVTYAAADVPGVLVETGGSSSRPLSSTGSWHLVALGWRGSPWSR